MMVIEGSICRKVVPSMTISLLEVVKGRDAAQGTMIQPTCIISRHTNVAVGLFEDNRLYITTAVAFAFNTILAYLSRSEYLAKARISMSYRSFFSTLDATFSAGCFRLAKPGKAFRYLLMHPVLVLFFEDLCGGGAGRGGASSCFTSALSSLTDSPASCCPICSLLSDIT